jgi:hypothetical protein
VVSYTPGRPIPGERAPGIHWIGGLSGPQSRCRSVTFQNAKKMYRFMCLVMRCQGTESSLPRSEGSNGLSWASYSYSDKFVLFIEGKVTGITGDCWNVCTEGNCSSVCSSVVILPVAVQLLGRT